MFDIATASAAVQVVLKPSEIPAGHTAESWQCKSRNAFITDPAKVSEVMPGEPLAGLNVTIDASEAVSCVLFLS